MKRTRLILLLAIVFIAQAGRAQDDKKVTDIIGDIERSLKMMIEKEGATPTTAVMVLREQVAHLKSLIAVHKDSPDSLARRAAVPGKKNSGDMKSAFDESSLALLQLSTLLCDLKKTIEEEKAAQAALQKNQSPPAVTVSGVVYTYFTYSIDGTDGPDANRFDFDRMYLTAKSQLFEGAKFQVTTDIYRNTAAGSYYSGLGMRVKFGYLDLALTNSLSLRFGMIPSHWMSFIDSYWKYRGVAPTITDRQSYFSSADLGASLSYALPAKLGEVSGYIMNGGGYTNPETNRFKDVAVRVSITPFPESSDLHSLMAAGYLYKGANAGAGAEALPRDRIGAMLSYSYSVVSATAEYHHRRDALTSADTVTAGNGVSLFGEVKAPFESMQNRLSLVWRYDLADPNLEKGADMQRLAIVGLSYKLNERVNFVADYQGATAESALYKRPDGTRTDADKRWFLHLIVTY